MAEGKVVFTFSLQPSPDVEETIKKVADSLQAAVGNVKIGFDVKESVEKTKKSLSEIPKEAESAGKKIKEGIADGAEKSAKSIEKATKASQELAKEQEQIAKFQQTAGKTAEDIAKRELEINKDLLSGKKTYSQVIKEERTSLESLYQKKTQLAKANKQETDEYKQLEAAEQAQIKVVAKLEDENNALKNSIDSVRKELTPLQRDLKQTEQGVDTLVSTTKDAKTGMLDYVDSIDTVNDALEISEAKFKQVNRFLEETSEKLRNGEAEFSTFEDRAKAAAQGMLELEKAGLKGTEAYTKLAAVQKEAVKNATEYKILEEQVASAAEGNIAKYDQMSSSFSNLGNIFSNIGGDIGNVLGSMSGIGSALTSLPAQFDAIKKSGATGFSAIAQSATAGLAAIGPAVLMAVQAIDQMIAGQEKATIEAGKTATAMAQETQAYALGEKSMSNRVDLIQKIGESNQELAAKMYASAGSVEDFDAALAEANATLNETRALGEAQEWDTQETGGGLLGWVKKLGTDLETVFANAGKAQVALDDMYAMQGQIMSNIGSATSSFQDLEKSNASKILDLNAQIFDIEGKKNEAHKIRMQMLDAELGATVTLQNEKIKGIEMQKASLMSSASQLASANQDLMKNIFSDKDLGFGYLKEHLSTAHGVDFKRLMGIKSDADFDKQINIYRDFLDKGFGKVKDGTLKSIEELQKWLAQQTGVDIFSGLADQVYARGEEGLSVGMAGWQREIQESIEALFKFKPQELNNNALVKMMDDQIKGLKDKIPELEKQANIIYGLTDKIWQMQNKDVGKTVSTPTFKMPELENMDDNIKRFMEQRKKFYDKNFGKASEQELQGKLTASTKSLADYIAKDTTLQTALTAQQTKLAELQKKLPSLTGAARIEAEKQIKETQGNIVKLTDELNTALLNTASVRADIAAETGAILEDIQLATSGGSLDQNAIKDKVAGYQSQIDTIKAGYDKLTDAEKLAADNQIASIQLIIDAYKGQITSINAVIKTIEETADATNESLIESYNAALDAYNATVDVRTDAEKAEDSYQEKLKQTNQFYDDQIAALKKMGVPATVISDMQRMKDEAVGLVKETRDLETATADYNKQLEHSATLFENMSDYASMTDEWAAKFDKNMSGLRESMAEADKLKNRIDQIGKDENTALEQLKNNKIDPTLASEIKKVLGLSLTGNLTEDTELIKKYFEKLREMARDLASDTKDTGKGITDLNKELEKLRKENSTFKISFDDKEFTREIDQIMGNGSESVTAKLKRQHESASEEVNDWLKGEQDKLYAEWEAYQAKGLEEGFDAKEYEAKWQILQEKLTDLNNDGVQKRVDLERKAALDVAAAWKTEYDKLNQMQDAYDQRIKNREKQTADARTEVAKYVTRAKLKESDRQGYDQAQALGDEYERLRKAGMTQKELEEWLALKTVEITTDMNEEQKKSFNDFWGSRKKAAEEAVWAEEQAWNAQTKKIKDELAAQKQLVAELKTQVDAAISSMRELLTLKGQITEGDASTPKPEAGSGFTPINPVGGNKDGGSLISEPQDFPLKDGDRYSEVKDKLSPNQRPSSSLVSQIGSAGVIDLIWKDYTKSGGKGGAWVQLRETNAKVEDAKITPGSSSEKTGSESKKDEIESESPLDAQQIKDLAEAYKALRKLIDETYAAARTEAGKTSEEISKEWSKLAWNKNEPPGKMIFDGFVTTIGDMGVEGRKKLYKTLWGDPGDTGTLQYLAWHDMPDWGTKAANNWYIGFASGLEEGQDTIETSLDNVVGVLFETHSPAKAGPLHYIGDWAVNAGTYYIQEFASAIETSIPILSDSLSVVKATLIGAFDEVGANVGTSIADGINSGVGHSQAKLLDTVNGIGVPVSKTGDLTFALKSMKNTLLAADGAQEKYGQRTEFEGQTVDEFAAFKDFAGLSGNAKQINKAYETYNADEQRTKTELANMFYKQSNKAFFSIDLGNANYDLVKRMVEEHPEMKAWHPLQLKLKEQYPELLDKLIKGGVLIPTKADPKYEQGVEVGWTQDGNVYNKWSMESEEPLVDKSLLTFNDFMQKLFNEETDGGVGLDQWYEAREKFLKNWDQDRLAELTQKYIDYVNEATGGLKTSEEIKNELMAQYSDSELTASMKSGQSLEEALVKSDYGSILKGSEQLGKDVFDSQKLVGGGWYDKSGKEVFDNELLKDLMTGMTGGGVDTGTLMEYWKRRQDVGAIKAGILETGMEKMKQNLGIKGDIKVGAMKYAGFDKNGHYHYEWLVIPPRPGMIEEETRPCAVTVLTGGEYVEMSKKYNVYTLTGEEVEKLGYDQKKLREAREWVYAIVDISKVAGHRVDESPFYTTDQQLQQEIETALAKLPLLAKKTGVGGGFTEGEKFDEYTYKEKYETVKGDYTKGAGYLRELYAGVEDSKRGEILDAAIRNIDEKFKPSVTDKPLGSDLAGQVEGGDALGGTAHILESYISTKKAMKAILANALGYDKEYSEARGWIMPDETSDVMKLAYEELLKNVDMIDDQLPTTDQSNTGFKEGESSSGIEAARKYIQSVVDAGLTPQSLKEINDALGQAIQTGWLTDSEAASLVKEMIPSGVKMEKPRGVVTDDDWSETQAILMSQYGPWNPYSGTDKAVIGQRNFLGKWRYDEKQGYGNGIQYNPTLHADALKYYEEYGYDYQGMVARSRDYGSEYAAPEESGLSDRAQTLYNWLMQYSDEQIAAWKDSVKETQAMWAAGITQSTLEGQLQDEALKELLAYLEKQGQTKYLNGEYGTVLSEEEAAKMNEYQPPAYPPYGMFPGMPGMPQQQLTTSLVNTGGGVGNTYVNIEINIDRMTATGESIEELMANAFRKAGATVSTRQ